MLGNYFYHQIIRKTVIAFGTLFNDIHVRHDDGAGNIISDIKGLSSGALFSVTSYNKDDTTDKYNEGDIFESEADLLIDFSESNPFGSF